MSELGHHENLGDQIPPDMLQIPKFDPEKPSTFWKVDKDERDASGNGYVEVITDATVMGSDAIHRFRYGYKVSDKEGGTPGKKWERISMKDISADPEPTGMIQ